jgi:hypothetical protein
MINGGIRSIGGNVSGSVSTSAAAVLTAANTSFELTPLSGLIKQSYKDIGTLRAIEAERARSGGVVVVEGEGGESVDFDGMEEHLRRFEEVYRQVCVPSFLSPISHFPFPCPYPKLPRPFFLTPNPNPNPHLFIFISFPFPFSPFPLRFNPTPKQNKRKRKERRTT